MTDASVRLVITRQLPAWSRERLAAVDRRLDLRYVPTRRDDYRIVATPLLKHYPSREEVDAELGEAEILIGGLVQALPERAPKLRLLQITSTGLNLVDMPRLAKLAPEVRVATAAGTHALAIAEWGILACLFFARGMPRALASRARREWDWFVASEVRGKTLGIVGLGNIGTATARLARALGMRLIATRRSATHRQRDVEGVDELLPARELLDLLKDSDYVYLSLPATPATDNLIGEEELRAMKPTAYLINVARGQIVNEPALLQALKEGWIAGAALDVFAQEPLPPENEIWALPNVFMTAHHAGTTDSFLPRLTDHLCENLRRYLAGEPLLSQVDRALGY